MWFTVRNRLTSFGVLLTLSLVAAACSGGGADDTAVSSTVNVVTTTEAVVAEPTTTTVGDVVETTTTQASPGQDVRVGLAYDAGGRDDSAGAASAGAGLDEAVAELGIEPTELEASADGENREGIVGLLAESGSDLVIAVGAGFADGVASSAATYPETTFAIVDAVVEAPNVTSLVFADHEGSALVGAAAALKSNTDKIGFIGDEAGTERIETVQAGYEAGAMEINPDVEIVVEYLGEAPTSDEAREIALGMFNDGVGVVYFAVDGPGASVFEAAMTASEEGESKVWVIGYVSDRYETATEAVQPYILTSMVKRVDFAVFDTINNFVTESQQSDVVVFDLGADGVGYSTSGGFVDDISGKLDELRTRIVTGDFVVPEALPEG